MKLTKAELKKIIKEELGRFAEGPDDVADAPAPEATQSKAVGKIEGKFDQLASTFKTVTDEDFGELITMLFNATIKPNGKVTPQKAKEVFGTAWKSVNKMAKAAKEGS